jgi:hypothetical protein
MPGSIAAWNSVPTDTTAGAPQIGQRVAAARGCARISCAVE